jgi:polyhydroxyalkanoate synthesis regulator protein
MFNMFSPFAGKGEVSEADTAETAAKPGREASDESLAQVKAQLDALQKQLEDLSKK